MSKKIAIISSPIYAQFEGLRHAVAQQDIEKRDMPATLLGFPIVKESEALDPGTIYISPPDLPAAWPLMSNEARRDWFDNYCAEIINLYLEEDADQ